MPKKRRNKYGNPGKNKLLAGDLQRLVQPTGIANPTKLGGQISMFGGPHERGTALLDPTDSVLMSGMTVCAIDRIAQGDSLGQAIFMTLEGRVNKKTDQVSVGFIFGADGAAAIISELLALTDRFGAELLTDLTDRLVTLKHENNVDLHFLKAAIEIAMEE